uniref:Uncharacterized protein n=1 Tax=Plectus sambesii TaxID=2011161 RepID=A0A914VKM6_9BILA
MASRLEKVRKRKNLAPDPELNKTLGLDEDDETPVDAIPLPGETEAKSSRIEQSAPASTEYPSPPKQSSVRPWDRGKNTFSQEKWVDKRRDERDNDFAPPSSYFTR